MSTTRRTLLAGLAASPMALGLEIVAATPAPLATPPDAALIAAAACAVDLARRDRVATDRHCDRLERYADMAPTRPTYASTVPGWPPVEEKTAAEMRKHLAAATGVNTDAALDSYRARIAIVEDYEAECEAVARRVRLEPAELLAHRAADRFRDAADALASMRANTMAGVAAKARVVTYAREQAGYAVMPEWLDELAVATLADTIAIGGAS